MASEYGYMKNGELYDMYKGETPLRTPMGAPVRTNLKVLADRLVKDLNKYGEDPSNPASIVAFHYAMIDFFYNISRSENERSIAIGLDKENDWTFNCPTATPEPMMEWMALFGTHSSQAERGKKWLSSLTIIQLCAVCIIGRALESVNIPFIVATELEREALESYAKQVCAHYPYVNVKELRRYFDNYLFYFNLENAGETESDQGHRSFAVANVQKALQIPEQTDGMNQPSVDKLLLIIAGLYHHFGPDQPEVAYGLNKLAELYYSQGQYAQAGPLYKRALEIYEKALGPDHLDVATSLENMAKLYRKTGQEKSAQELEKRAAAIRD